MRTIEVENKIEISTELAEKLAKLRNLYTHVLTTGKNKPSEPELKNLAESIVKASHESKQFKRD